MRIILVVAFIGCVGAASPARAGSIAETLESFGFFGQWARDCTKPPALENSRRTVAPTGDGGAHFVERLGEDFQPNDYVVRDARRSGDDTLVLRIELNGSVLQDLTIQRKDGAVRTMRNVVVTTGKAVVTDGKIVTVGRDTPWLQRCPDDE